MYAQKLEGDAWIGERMDVGKIEKMSGMVPKVKHPPTETVGSWVQKISSLVNCMSLCKRYGRKIWRTADPGKNDMNFVYERFHVGS